jgi:HEAT repeat protein
VISVLDSRYLLTDEQMVQFITKGYLVLRNDLPNALHDKVFRQIQTVLAEEGNPGNNILPRIPEIQKFFDTPTVQGALSSILGPDYYLHPHRHCHYNPPGNPNPGGGAWHKDGFWNAVRSHRPWWAMIFYYTQDMTEELGPTAVLPGSQYLETFPGREEEAVLPAGPAGTMVLVHFDIWHRATHNRSRTDRFMLKFQFARRSAPAFPSWNNKTARMPIPEASAEGPVHLWLDVWSWLRGERPEEERAAAGLNVESDGVAGIVRTVAGSGGGASRERAYADMKGAAGIERASAGQDGAAEHRRADDAWAGSGLEPEESALQAVHSSRDSVRDSVAETAALLDSAAETEAIDAGYALARMGEAGIRELTDRLKSGTETAAQRAAYGLASCGDAAVDGLLEALAHSDERRRALACFALGMTGGTHAGAEAALLRALNDSSERVRRNALEALGMLKNPSRHAVSAVAKRLEAAVSEEEDAPDTAGRDFILDQGYIKNKIAYTAALTLLRIGSHGEADEVTGALARALESRDRYVRAYAFEALAQLRSPQAVEVLIRHSRTSRWCPDTTKASTF